MQVQIVMDTCPMATGELPCPTCLTLGRTMLPLRDAARAYTMLLTGLRDGVNIDLLHSIRVCWECHGVFNRILKFQKQVLDANILLRSYEIMDDDEKRHMSFSQLAITTKLNYDEEMYHYGQLSDAETDNCSPVSLYFQKEDDESILPDNKDHTHEPYRIEKLDPMDEDEDPTFKPEESRPRRTTRKLKVKETEPSGMRKKDDRKLEKVQQRTVSRVLGAWPGKSALMRGKKKNVKIATITMSKSEMEQFRENDRSDKQYARTPFKCQSCIKSFKYINLLEKHNVTHHSEEAGSYVCDVCSVHFPTPEQLHRHHKKHFYLYVCSVCGYTQRRLPEVFTHYTTLHESGKQHECDHCNEVFETARKMRYHREITHKEVFKCEFCGKTMRNAQSFKSHLLIHTGMPDLKCSICSKSCRGESGLYAHMRTAHTQEQPEDAFCVQCGIQFKSKAIYKSHLRTSVKHATPAQLKFRCAKCEKKFISETALNQHHKYYHQDYVCHICDKRMNNFYSLDKHVKFTHEGREMPRKHICETCGKGFKTKRALMSHLLTHTGERPHVCDICTANFAQKSTLRTHQRLVHLKLKRTSSATTTSTTTQVAK